MAAPRPPILTAAQLAARQRKAAVGADPDEVGAPEAAASAAGPAKPKFYPGSGPVEDRPWKDFKVTYPDNLPKVWESIVKTLSPSEQAQSAELLEKLAYLDSIHDFWPERGSRKKRDGSSSSDSDDTRMEDVHNFLIKTIQAYRNTAAWPSKPSNDIGDILIKDSNNQVHTTSGIENIVLSYIKKKYKPFNEPEITMTVSEILKDWKFVRGTGEAYKNRIKSLPNAIEIISDPEEPYKTIKTLDENERGIIGFFLLAYLNPEENPGKQKPGFTFDMAASDVSNIFSKFTQTFNAIYPQNVADSAITSFSALLGRNKFHRANYSESKGDTNVIEQVVRTNAYTRGKYTIKFVDRGFSNKNRFAFSVQIIDNTTREVVATIPFKKDSAEQGPPVNYLADLMASNARKLQSKPGAKKGGAPQQMKPGAKKPVAAPEPPKKSEKPDKAAKIEFVKGKPIDLKVLFDIKRMGDQEQMLVTTAYGVTGDRFAGVFRRLLRMPGIFQSTKGLKVWRAPVKIAVPAGKTPEQAAAEAADKAAKDALEFRRKQIVEKLKIVNGVMKGEVDPVYKDLVKMKAEVDKGAESGVIFRSPLGYKDRLTKEFVRQSYTSIASEFATYVLRAHMRDISERIGKLIGRITTFNESIKNYDAAACSSGQPKISNPIEPCTPADKNLQLGDALDKLEEFITSFKELESITIAFRLPKDGEEPGLKTRPIYTPIFGPDNRLLKNVTNSWFNFSSESYTHPETGLAIVVARLLDLSSSPRLDLVTSQIRKLLEYYFLARDDIKESFTNEESKLKLEEATEISIFVRPERVVSIVAEPDEQQGLIEVLRNLAQYQVVGPAGVGAVAAADGQAGGAFAGDPRQYRDLHDLFAELCVDASFALSEEGEEAPGAGLAAAAADGAAGFFGGAGEDEVIINEDDGAAAMDERPDAAPDSQQSYVDALTDIEVKWKLGVDEIRNTATQLYGVAYEQSPVVDLITWILSFRTKEVDSVFYKSEDVKPRDRVIVQDIGGLILTHQPVEPYILLVLKSIGEQILTKGPINRLNYDPDSVELLTTTYSSPNKWKELPTVIATFFRNPNPDPEVVRDLLEGTKRRAMAPPPQAEVGAPEAMADGAAGPGDEEEDDGSQRAKRTRGPGVGLEGGAADTSNGPNVNATGSSRRGLYEGLRKRGGSGPPPEF